MDTYEKKYKEAINKAEEIIRYYKERNRDEAAIEDLKEIFPELAESEDEIIRKELIRLFNDTVWNDSSFRFYDLDKEKVIAWLEKQDKQKLTWSEEDEKVRKALKEAGYEWSEETHELKKIEQNPAWSEEDEKMIDEIIDYMKPMPIFFESTKGKSGKEYTQKFVKNAINWLKSLKERIGE